MRYLAIDYGLERTGLAFSEGEIAFPLCTLILKECGNRKALLQALVDKVIEIKADAIVMGLPVLLDGKDSEITKQVKNIVVRLKRRINLPIYYMPEILSSEQALFDLKEANVSIKKRKLILDQQAAVRILSSFLNEPECRRKLA